MGNPRREQNILGIFPEQEVAKTFFDCAGQEGCIIPDITSKEILPWIKTIEASWRFSPTRSDPKVGVGFFGPNFLADDLQGLGPGFSLFQVCRSGLDLRSFP